MVRDDDPPNVVLPGPLIHQLLLLTPPEQRLQHRGTERLSARGPLVRGPLPRLGDRLRHGFALAVVQGECPVTLEIVFAIRPPNPRGEVSFDQDQVVSQVHSEGQRRGTTPGVFVVAINQIFESLDPPTRLPQPEAQVVLPRFAKELAAESADLIQRGFADAHRAADHHPRQCTRLSITAGQQAAAHHRRGLRVRVEISDRSADRSAFTAAYFPVRRRGRVAVVVQQHDVPPAAMRKRHAPRPDAFVFLPFDEIDFRILLRHRPALPSVEALSTTQVSHCPSGIGVVCRSISKVRSNVSRGGCS